MDTRNNAVHEQLTRILVTLVNQIPDQNCSAYRNRLGIDSYALARIIAKPAALALFITQLYKQPERFMDTHASATSTAYNLRRMLPYTRGDLMYSGDTEININNVITHVTDALVFPSTVTGSPIGSRVMIINYKSKERLERDAAIIERNPAFKKADKETTVFLTTTPYETVRLYEIHSDDGIVMVLLAQALTNDTVHRVGQLLFAAQCNAIAESPEIKPITDAIFKENLSIKFLNGALGGLVEFLEDNFLKEIIEKQLKEQEEKRAKALLEAVAKIPNLRIKRARQLVEDTQAEYMRRLENLHAYEAKYTNALTELALAQTTESTVNDALKTFLKALGNKLRYINVMNDNLQIIADTELMFFDATKLKMYEQNPRSDLNLAQAWVKALVEDVFKTKKAKLHMTAGFTINMVSGSLNALRAGTVNNDLFTEDARTGIPNPHHEFYNCFGDNRTVCAELVQKGKLDEALMTMYAALGAINISDTAVFNKFLRSLGCDYYSLPYIEKDGELLTPVQYKALYEKSIKEGNANAQNEN